MALGTACPSGASGRGGSASGARVAWGRPAAGAPQAPTGILRLPHFFGLGHALPGSIGWLRGPLKGARRTTDG